LSSLPVLNGLVSLRVVVTVLEQTIPHAPAWHVCWDRHAVVVPHWPHESQVCTPLLWGSHWTAPGVHTGAEGHEQAPQAQALPQVWEPCVLQVCWALGVQDPEEVTHWLLPLQREVPAGQEQLPAWHVVPPVQP
jgi:hypothetical protein